MKIASPSRPLLSIDDGSERLAPDFLCAVLVEAALLEAVHSP